MNILLGLAVGLVFFLCTIKAYTIGISHGKQLVNGNVPKVTLNPVQAVREHQEIKETKKETDKLMQGIENLFSYDGTPQKDVDE